MEKYCLKITESNVDIVYEYLKSVVKDEDWIFESIEDVYGYVLSDSYDGTHVSYATTSDGINWIKTQYTEVECINEFFKIVKYNK